MNQHRRGTDRPPFHIQLAVLFFDCMRPFRLVLCGIAFGWAYTLALPGDVLDRPAYHVMRAVFPEQVWTGLFLSYACLAFWRLFWSRSRFLASVINLFGLALFTVAAISFYMADLKPVPATLATEAGVAVTALWVFIRTANDND